eukprot:CAMPEP_0113532600 /NCGR_PEP_ID=MMETSP0015_2-20120614/4150_1 /TAXON_ID=2838 /ORGANISM="Odontella" /LENGTH=167 /DNA_ID=CAMNT_0000431581 /DNA_START=249 /DNA_END=752 /DNA_ORIENTATION=- /assembly_acc=CAM_ASM_000160
MVKTQYGALCDRPSKTTLGLFWFGGKKEDRSEETGGKGANDAVPDQSQVRVQQAGASSSGVMGGTAAMMESFKQSQEVGKKTTAMLQELGASTVEGSAANGKVRVFADGQQRPTGVDVDEKFLRSVSAEDLNAAMMAAMQEAHTKSMELMEEKMQALYAEIGLPPSK